MDIYLALPFPQPNEITPSDYAQNGRRSVALFRRFRKICCVNKRESRVGTSLASLFLGREFSPEKCDKIEMSRAEAKLRLDHQPFRGEQKVIRIF